MSAKCLGAPVSPGGELIRCGHEKALELFAAIPQVGNWKIENTHTVSLTVSNSELLTHFGGSLRL